MKVQIDEYERGTFVPSEDNIYTFNVAEDGTISSADPELLLGLCSYSLDDEEEGNFYWGGFGDRDICLTPVTATLVEIPENLKVEHWVFSDEYETGFANVAFDSDDIYVQGLCRSLKDSWVKGSVTGNKVSFPSGQYLGCDGEIFYISYFQGADVQYEDDVLTASIAPEAIFNYDAENKKLTSENGYMSNGDLTVLFPLYIYNDVTVELQNRNVDTPPAAPYDLVYSPADEDGWDNAYIWVQIPNTDTDGNLLYTDNLYYQVLFDGVPYEFSNEDYFELPESTDMLLYDFEGYDVYVEGTDHTVYLYSEPENSIGVRSVYINENGDKLYSEVVSDEFGRVKDSFLDKEVSSVMYYDLSGRRISERSAGIMVRTTIFSDGTRRHEKIVRRY